MRSLRSPGLGPGEHVTQLKDLALCSMMSCEAHYVVAKSGPCRDTYHGLLRGPVSTAISQASSARMWRGGFRVPIYEFYCADCRSKFEVLTSYEAAKGQMPCASCGGANVRKLLSLVARPARGSANFDDYSDLGDDGGDFEEEGGCSCQGGACSCHN